jgi:hypothetical protein
MIRFILPYRNLLTFAVTMLTVTADALRYLCLCLRPSPALAAENLFLRKQLALYQERQIKPRRATKMLRGFSLLPWSLYLPPSHMLARN